MSTGNLLDQIPQSSAKPSFCEEEWLKLLFLISDTQTWLNDLTKGIFFQIPLEDKKKLFRKTYNLTAPALAHILEKHYFKIPRYPGASKFTISLVDILHHLREASQHPTFPVSGALLFKREIDTGSTVGFDQTGQYTNIITIITDAGGQIKTAFPGSYKQYSPF